MSAFKKVLVWPEHLKPVNELTLKPDSGISVAKYATGSELRRTYYDKPLAEFSAKFFLSPLLSTYNEDMAWFNALETGIDSFLFMDPHKRSLRNVIGIGNGVRTTWVVPYSNLGPDVFIFRNGELQKAFSTASDYLITIDGPNLLGYYPSFSDPSSGELVADPNVSLNDAIEYRVADNNYNMFTSKLNKAAVWGGLRCACSISIADGRYINHLFEAVVPDANQAVGGIKSNLTIDTGNTVSPRQTPSIGKWGNYVYTHQVTGDSNLIISRVMTEAADTGIYYVGAQALTRGDLLEWYPGNVLLPVIVFLTPPAAGDTISAMSSEANMMMKMKATGISHAISPDGNRFITVRLKEVGP